jgi:hypothetical protein
MARPIEDIELESLSTYDSAIDAVVKLKRKLKRQTEVMSKYVLMTSKEPKPSKVLENQVTALKAMVSDRDKRIKQLETTYVHTHLETAERLKEQSFAEVALPLLELIKTVRLANTYKGKKGTNENWRPNDNQLNVKIGEITNILRHCKLWRKILKNEQAKEQRERDKQAT